MAEMSAAPALADAVDAKPRRHIGAKEIAITMCRSRLPESPSSQVTTTIGHIEGVARGRGGLIGTAREGTFSSTAEHGQR
jgi:hypothetical protein